MKTRVALLAVLWCACSNERAPRVDFSHKGPPGAPVAKFGGDAISDEELRVRFLEMSPYARTRYQTVEQKREYLEGLVRFELLTQEAVRRGLANDPEVVESTRKVMVQRLLNSELEKAAQSPVTQEELQVEYDRHRSDYQRPEMVRLSHIFFAAPKAEAPRRASQLGKAQAALKQAQVLNAQDFGAFGLLAQQLSEEPRTKPLDGDMRFLARDELSRQYGAEVLAASDELKAVGDVLPRVLETEQGFHILKLHGRQPAVNQSPADVKLQLESRIRYDRRSARMEQLIEELKKKAGYTVDAEALSRVPVDLKAPMQQPAGPSPGFLGPPVSGPPPTTVAPSGPAR
ncbi:MAG TPA: peptidylprolyl isomerase [Myxococcaceae bacterium]|nr:peptidylprolyl isomerase [Myxococcaceae bacterium]